MIENLSFLLDPRIESRVCVCFFLTILRWQQGQGSGGSGEDISGLGTKLCQR